MHLPNPEAAFVAAARGPAKLVVTYHIDAFLPDGLVNRFGLWSVDQVCKVALRKADLVITNSEEQARGSRIWPTIRRRALLPIPSPCLDRSGGAPVLRDGAGPFVAIGVGLEAQRRPSLPREPFDERLDWLVTEQAVVRF